MSEPKEWKEAWSEQHRGVSRNVWSDRLFVVGLPQTMSRPLRAVCRRPLGAESNGSDCCRSGVSASSHRSSGRGVGSMPRAWMRTALLLRVGGLDVESVALREEEFVE